MVWIKMEGGVTIPPPILLVCNNCFSQNTLICITLIFTFATSPYSKMGAQIKQFYQNVTVSVLQLGNIDHSYVI